MTTILKLMCLGDGRKGCDRPCGVVDLMGDRFVATFFDGRTGKLTSDSVDLEDAEHRFPHASCERHRPVEVDVPAVLNEARLSRGVKKPRRIPLPRATSG